MKTSYQTGIYWLNLVRVIVSRINSKRQKKSSITFSNITRIMKTQLCISNKSTLLFVRILSPEMP